MTRYSIEPRTRKYVKVYGFLSCRRNLSKKYEEKSWGTATKTGLNAGRRLLSKPSKPDNFNVENLTRRIKYLHTVIRHYWSRWKIEYLTELREYHRRGKEVDIRINVGDIARVEDPALNQNYWKLGKITKLIKGHDERVRAASVKSYNNNSIHQLINRPICKLYPLKIRANENIEKR